MSEPPAEGPKGKPIHLPRINNIHPTIFERHGRQGTFDSFELQRRYMKDGYPHFSNSFTLDDIDDLIAALEATRKTMQ